MACDLEVASFFDKKNPKPYVEGHDQDDELADDDFYSSTYDPVAAADLNYNLEYDDDDFNPTEEEDDYRGNDDGDEEDDSQNLDFLVRQLVAEASLSNLNLNMDPLKQNQVKSSLIISLLLPI